MATPTPSIWKMKPKKRRQAEEGESSTKRGKYIRLEERDSRQDHPATVSEKESDKYFWGPPRKRQAAKPVDDDATVTTLETRPATLNLPLATRRLPRSNLINLTVAAETIERFLDLLTSRPEDMTPKYTDGLRKTIAKLPFYNVNREYIRRSCIIHRLRSLSSALREGGLAIPEDIVLDAEALANRWEGEDFDPHLLRGVDAIQRVRNAGEGRSRGTKTRSYALETDYMFRINPNVIGHNGLVVGQWWPLQICVLRDGGHGDTEAGISGNKELGALSVIISGSSYKDEDHGETVFYCGTRGIAKPTTPSPATPSPTSSPTRSESDQPLNERPPPRGTPSANTQLLLTSLEKNTPVRLHRSHKAMDKSKFAPSKGIRYDGLYRVTGCVELDPEYAMYRFTLEREPGQPEIRWRGDGVRPNEEELGSNGWAEVQRLLKGCL